MTKKYYTVLIDGNYSYCGGMDIDSIRGLLEDKDGRNGFNLTKKQIDTAISKADKLEINDILKDDEVFIDHCGSKEFGDGNGNIRIARAFF